MPAKTLIEKIRYADSLNKEIELRLKQATAEFMRESIGYIGHIDALLEYKFPDTLLNTDDAKRQICKRYSHNQLYASLRDGKVILPRALEFLNKQMNFGIRFFLSRINKKDYHDYLGGIRAEHFAELIGESNRIKDRGFFAYDNLVNGAIYGGTIGLVAGTIYYMLAKDLGLPPIEQIGIYWAAGISSAISALGAQARRFGSLGMEKAEELQSEIKRLGLIKK